MSFPRYPKYKPSGLEWLGVVPDHWELGRLKKWITKIESGTSVNATDEPAEEHQYGVLKTSCVYSGFFDPKENKRVVQEEISRLSCPVTAETLIVSRMNTPDLIGAAGHVSQKVPNIFLPDRLWQIHFVGTSPKFIHYWTCTTSYRSQVQMACTGTSSSMKNLSQDQFCQFCLAVPSTTEQKVIIDFVDHETAKIDALIAEQQRLIELLKEKRQAVISHAVTKGLNPHVRMKDSGVEWLGEVPEGWRIVQLRMLAKMIQTGPFGSQLHSEDYVVNGIPVINPSNIQDGKIEPDWSCSITAEDANRLSQHKLIDGDIVFGRRGEMGRCALVSATEVGWICGTGSLNVRLLPEVFPPFISIYLRTEYVREWLKLESVGSTMDNLNTQILGAIKLPLPNLSEQTTIVAYLETELAKFDTLTIEAQRGISFLQERRTALISAAVTGQIDVRGFTPVAV